MFRWSFGGNRLHIKSELRLMSDVLGALQNVAVVGAKPTITRQSLHSRHELLATLLQSETSRLVVWLAPTDNGGQGLPAEHRYNEVSPPETSVNIKY